MLHLAADLVAPEFPAAVVPDQVGGNSHVRFGGPVSFGWLSSDFSDAGHIGDPAGANAEAGRELFETTLGFLRDALIEVQRFEYGAG